jgi:hypothetical protein
VQRWQIPKAKPTFYRGITQSLPLKADEGQGRRSSLLPSSAKAKTIKSTSVARFANPLLQNRLEGFIWPKKTNP